MIQPGFYDITMQSNGDFDLTFQVKDSTNTPINLTGSTIESEIWTNGKTAKLVDFTVTVMNALTGTFKLTLTREQTGNVLQDSEYDIRIIDANGKANYWVRGKVNLEEGITE